MRTARPRIPKAVNILKVLVLGGTGVFGSRLARLLVRDGHEVTIAGRNLKNAQVFAMELGCKALMMDRNRDLGAVAEHDVVVDAAGPYHAYQGDPYRLARAAIKAGVHYLDLSDNAAFCDGIGSLDAEARAAGVCAMSGMSSVPALSSAAVRALIEDNNPDTIEVAILPGNRSPRGLSVMASILSQSGQSMRVFRDGKWTSARGWSSPKNYSLPGGLIRQGWQIEVSDITLFPAHFGACTVTFRAGLELWVMRYGLWVFALLRRWVPIPITGPVLSIFKWSADRLSRFGTDRGGMSVEVTIGPEKRWWRLRVDDGDGPFIPAIAVRALLRRKTLPTGAGPALEMISLAEAKAAMSDLNTVHEHGKVLMPSIFQQVLGRDFETLPKPIRDTHLTCDASVWKGSAAVQRGTGIWSKTLGWLFRFPAETDHIPVKVTKTVTSNGETWQRQFGKSSFRSHLVATPYGMTERFGPFTFLLGLRVEGGRLLYPVRAGRFGPIPLPKWLLPISEAHEFEENSQFHFDVKLRSPITHGLLVHYKGMLAAA